MFHLMAHFLAPPTANGKQSNAPEPNSKMTSRVDGAQNWKVIERDEKPPYIKWPLPNASHRDQCTYVLITLGHSCTS